MRAATAVGLGIVVYALVAGVEATASEAGKQKFAVCAGCHGFDGQGLQQVNAPALAGQESWYLVRQLENYRQNIRGGDQDDVHGKTMATMSLALKDAQDIKIVADYISSRVAAELAPTLAGDSKRGQTLYATCAACHGAKAEGNAALNAPSLVGQSDWYQVAQLKKFKSGARGKHPQDIYGQQMAPMAGTLADEQAMVDVVTYINSLR